MLAKQNVASSNLAIRSNYRINQMNEEQIEEYWRIQWDIAITDDRERKLLSRQEELRNSLNATKNS